MILKVNGQSLEIEGATIIAEGAVEFASFTLSCDKSWDGFSKTVRFRHVSQEESFDVAGVEEERVYYIPSEVLLRGGVFVSVLGVKGDARISTTELAGFFVEGTLDSGRVPSVTPNAYAQYVNIVNEKTAEASKASEQAQGYCAETLALLKEAKEAKEATSSHEDNCRVFADVCRRVSLEVEDADTSMNYMVNSVKNAADTLISKGHELSLAETERVSNENVRADAERSRALAEQTRESAEEERALCEAGRVANERARILSEKEREQRLGAAEETLQELSQTTYKKASAIVGKLEGRAVLADDVENEHPLKLELVGNSTQEENPTISAPALINGVSSADITYKNKNILKCVIEAGRSFFVSGVNYTVLEGGKINVEGATEGVKSSFEFTGENFYLDPGKYVISGGNERCGVFVYNMDDKMYIAQSIGSDSEFTLEKRTNVRVRLYVFANTNIGNVTISPMLRYKGTAPSYEEHKEKSNKVSFSKPLYSIDAPSGKISDRAVFCEFSKTPYIERKLRECVLEGTEDVELISEKGDYNLFSFPLSEENKAYSFPDGKYENMGLCTHLPYTDNGEGECCWADGDRVYLKLNSADYPDVSSVLALFSRAYTGDVRFSIIYVLEESMVEEYEGEEISLYPETNEISTTNGTLRLEYIRSTNSMIEKIIDTLLSLDARVSLLEV